MPDAFLSAPHLSTYSVRCSRWALGWVPFSRVTETEIEGSGRWRPKHHSVTEQRLSQNTAWPGPQIRAPPAPRSRAQPAWSRACPAPKGKPLPLSREGVSETAVQGPHGKTSPRPGTEKGQWSHGAVSVVLCWHGTDSTAGCVRSCKDSGV